MDNLIFVNKLYLLILCLFHLIPSLTWPQTSGTWHPHQCYIISICQILFLCHRSVRTLKYITREPWESSVLSQWFRKLSSYYLLCLFRQHLYLPQPVTFFAPWLVLMVGIYSATNPRKRILPWILLSFMMTISVLGFLSQVFPKVLQQTHVILTFLPPKCDD